MAISLKPVSRQFELQSEPGSHVSFRQARTGDMVHLGNLFAEQTHEWAEEEVGIVRMKRKWNHEELKRERVFVTLSACDIEEEETGEPIFKFKDTKFGTALDMTPKRFYEIWGALSVELTDELYRYCLVVNPQFDPNRSGESSAT